MPRSMLSPMPRRRRSPLPILLILLFVFIVGGAIYLSTVDTEVATQRIELDVTNEALAK